MLPGPCQHTPMVAKLRPLSFGVSRKLLNLKTSDVLWCMSDPGWILATVGAMIEPWASGATIFIHHLPQFDPKVIVEVRRPTSQNQNLLGGHACFPKLDPAEKGSGNPKKAV